MAKQIIVQFTRHCSPFNAGETAGFDPKQARHLLRGDKSRNIAPAAILAPEFEQDDAEADLDAVQDPAALAHARATVAEAEAKEARKAAAKKEVDDAAAVLAEAYDDMHKDLCKLSRDELDLKAADLDLDSTELPNKSEVATAILEAQGHKAPEA